VRAGSEFALSGLDGAQREEFWAALALRHSKRLGARSIRRLLDTFGSALCAVRHVEDWPAATVSAWRGASIHDGSWRASARPEWEAAKALRARILLWTDPLYPPLLRELPDAPAVLYAAGDMSLLGNPCLGIVGKRQCSGEGLRAAAYFASTLAGAGITVVSGLARGVDQAAHTAALEKPGSTIAVLGAGIDVPYPANAGELYADIRSRGLLISELPPGTPPRPGNFPIRNRIISGLSLGVLVAEAASASGSLITARLALEQNRLVFAVPGALGAPTAEGCQELIRQGAKPVFAAHDVLLDLAPQLCAHVSPPPGPPASAAVRARRGAAGGRSGGTAPGTTPLSADPARQAARQAIRPADYPPDSPEARLLAFLSTLEGAASLDLLDDTLDLPPAALTSLLIRLEVRGLLRRLPGQYYALAESRI
jgi:DNA processing protein